MPPDRPPPPAAPSWDSTGWTLLGSTTVQGHTDRDVIQVAKRARWDKLTLVVTDSDLELLDFNVEFGNGEKWSPKLKHVFREGDRSRAIDLPGDDRHIAKLELVYKNTPGGGRARVEVYGKDVRGGGKPPPVVEQPPPPPPPPPPVAFDPAGWTLLGSQTVQGKRDKDVFPVGKKKGRFDRVMVVVTDSDLEMLDFVITFENKTKFEPKIRHLFKEGERSRAIDLPNSDRFINKIELKYANLPGGGKARLQIYARDTKEGADPGKPKDKADKKADKKDDKKKDKDEAKDPKYKPKK
jgi:hypothetical protein